jgi:sec-independent protein translocase protein TatA
MGLGLDNPIHIAFLLLLVLLVFGAKRLPEMGRSLGEGMRGFRDSLTGEKSNSSHAGELSTPVPAPIATQAPAPGSVNATVARLAVDSETHA